MKFIDLSVLFEPDTLSDIPIMRPHFQYSDHETGASEMMKTYGCAREDLPPGGCCADTRMSCVDHSGTHMGRALALCAHHERRRAGADH